MSLQKKVIESTAIALILGTTLLVSVCGNEPSPTYKIVTSEPPKHEVELLNNLPRPKSITIDGALNTKQASAMVQVAQRFYAFWNTGNEVLIPITVSPSFIDNTLPKGRPQGPEGLIFASRNFRKAVPDLQCSIEDIIVAGDKVTARLLFTGTHKGEFLGKKPTGKPIKFMAIDILHIKDGKLIEDWHLEDNLTLMQQLGVVPEV